MTDTANANSNFAVSLLRYFNPVDAHESGIIVEDPNGILKKLMTFVTNVSVLELLNAFIKVNEIGVLYEMAGRRPGDISTCFADARKAEKELGWKADLTIEDMVSDAWKY